MGTRAKTGGRFSPTPTWFGGAVIAVVMAFSGYCLIEGELADVNDPAARTEVINDTGKVLDWDCTGGPLTGVKPGESATLHVVDDPGFSCNAREIGAKVCPSVRLLQTSMTLTATEIISHRTC